MKNLFLAACALLLMAATVSAQSSAAWVAPTIKFGALTSTGKMTPDQMKSVQQLELVDAAGQSVVAFVIQIIRPDGKLVSHAPVTGSKLPAELQTMISRERTGSRIVIQDVRVKEEKTGATRAVNGFSVEII